MDIAYLQADSRYNKWLLQIIDSKTVIEHTLDKVKGLNCSKIVVAIYDCVENIALIEMMKKKISKYWGGELLLSKDENVNSRFVDLMTEEMAEYVFRVGADQVFLNVEIANNILSEMKKQNKEFFYHTGLSSVLPDIVSVNCLKRKKESILQYGRYFKALLLDESVKRYCIPDFCVLLYDFRVNSNMSYKICKNVMERKRDIYELSMQFSDCIRDKNNYLNKTGLMGSWILGSTYEEFFWDENENVNPWLGKSIIDLIVKRLNKAMRVFEWGMGNSTLFWSQYVGEVVSIESDMKWYQKMCGIIPENVLPKYCELEYNGEYCRQILNADGEFDIIFIDGRDRVRCSYNSVAKLKPDGVIIWDDTDRESYNNGYEF